MSSDHMSVDQVKAMLKRKQGSMSYAQLSRDIGCSAAYIADFYAGNRTPGPTILNYLGLEKQITYKLKWRKEDE